jgi:hypothetical protein
MLYVHFQLNGGMCLTRGRLRASPPAPPDRQGIGWAVLGALEGPPKILGPGFHTGAPKTPAQKKRKNEQIMKTRRFH